MFRAESFTIRDLEPVGTSRVPPAIGRANPRSHGRSRTIAGTIVGVTSLVLLAAGAAWFGGRVEREAVPVSGRPAPSPAVPAFPAWIEVPYLSDPPDQGDGSNPVLPVAGQGLLFDPGLLGRPQDALQLPPRVDPHQLQIGLSPRDLATLSQMRPADTAPAATGMPSAPAEAVTPGSQASQVAPGGTVPATTPVLRVDPDPAPVPPLGSTAASAPVVIDGRSAPTVASPPPPGPAVSIDPAPATQATEGAAPAVQAREAAQASVGVQHPDTASRARSIRRPSPAPAIARPRTPARDADQTASIGRHRAVGPRLVAHPRASLGRGQPDAGQPASSPPASSGSWTLPPALAPTD